MMTLKRTLFLVLLLMTAGLLYAQQSSADVVVDYLHPKKYVLGGIKVKGVKYLGESQILALTGLREGMEITVSEAFFGRFSQNRLAFCDGRHGISGAVAAGEAKGVKMEFPGHQEF